MNRLAATCPEPVHSLLHLKFRIFLNAFDVVLCYKMVICLLGGFLRVPLIGNLGGLLFVCLLRWLLFLVLLIESQIVSLTRIPCCCIVHKVLRYIMLLISLSGILKWGICELLQHRLESGCGAIHDALSLLSYRGLLLSDTLGRNLRG